jgi:hypothetical protein
MPAALHCPLRALREGATPAAKTRLSKAGAKAGIGVSQVMNAEALEAGCAASQIPRPLEIGAGLARRSEQSACTFRLAVPARMPAPAKSPVN